jgi:succinate-semialdehyde dehydrogenase / glutarate-semialdehyde dehydrogenase
VLNPANGEQLGMLPHASHRDLEETLASAERGFRAWRTISPFDRELVLTRAAEFMRERVDQIASTVTLEQGKPINEARLEVLGAADTVQWSAEEGRRMYG